MVRPIFGADAFDFGDARNVCCARQCDAESAVTSLDIPLCERHMIQAYREIGEFLYVKRDQLERPIVEELSAPDVLTMPELIKMPFGVCPTCDYLRLTRDRFTGEVRCSNKLCDYSATANEFSAMCEERIRKAAERPEIVYYIRFGDRVKIGTTKDLAQRLKAIPHDEVMATEPGGPYVEQQRHKQFEHLQVRKGAHREWFDLTPELAEHIAVVKSRMVSAAS